MSAGVNWCDLVLKLIDERRRLWDEYAERLVGYLYEGKEFPNELFKKIMGRDCVEYKEDCCLLSDWYYDHECSHQIAIELERILNILKSLCYQLNHPTEKKGDSEL